MLVDGTTYGLWLYYFSSSRKINVVVDALSQKSMGSFAHIALGKRLLVKDM